ncbi:MAG TPA: glucosamine-6-phosphate deaminase [Vicinamibacterales bacterium]|nr:glucosamine-6-phosphate deaminase [Vicinamibacterales bacterium]
MTRVRVFGGADALARALARDVATGLSRDPQLVLGLPTGRTPIPFYAELVRLYRAQRVDFRHATTFNLDEFLGIEPDDPRSYRAFMRHHLFDHVNLTARRIHFLNGATDDVRRECVRYERAIARAGGIDVQILGLGLNGHIGFNEPGRALAARTHVARLRPPSRHANAALFGNRVRAVPREALSMGMATILQARRIVLIATGASKARCVERMIEGPVTPRLPASFLQLHPNAEVWLDRAAAAAKLRITK